MILLAIRTNPLLNEGGKFINRHPRRMHPIDWGIRIFKADSKATKIMQPNGD